MKKVCVGGHQGYGKMKSCCHLHRMYGTENSQYRGHVFATLPEAREHILVDAWLVIVALPPEPSGLPLMPVITWF